MDLVTGEGTRQCAPSPDIARVTATGWRAVRLRGLVFRDIQWPRLSSASWASYRPPLNSRMLGSRRRNEACPSPTNCHSDHGAPIIDGSVTPVSEPQVAFRRPWAAQPGLNAPFRDFMEAIRVSGLEGEPLSLQPKARLRVLHLSSGNLYGGVERIITSLAEFRELQPLMEPVFGLTFEGRQADELRAAGSTVKLLGEVRLSRPWTVLAARRSLRHVLDGDRPDVVVCHNPWPLVVFAPAVRARGIPIVLWAHGALTGRNWLERLARRATPDLVLANSQFTAKTVATVFRKSAVRVLYAPARFRAPRSGARQALRSALAPEARVVVIQVSRIEETKGHRAHLVALSALRDDRSWVGWFVGGAQQEHERRLEAELKELAATLGIAARVRFLGERSDVPELLAAADVFCQPNATPDAFGLAFVEALAAGLPVLTTAIGGALEVVDGSCGILVPVGDEPALSEALARLVGDEGYRRRLGNAGRERAAKLCDPAIRLSELHSALASTLRDPPASRGNGA